MEIHPENPDFKIITKKDDGDPEGNLILDTTPDVKNYELYLKLDCMSQKLRLTTPIRSPHSSEFGQAPAFVPWKASAEPLWFGKAP